MRPNGRPAQRQSREDAYASVRLIPYLESLLFGLFDCVETSGDELVRGVVLVRGDEECAAEAGTGFADRAAEGVFVGTTPTRRGEAGGAFDRF